MDTTTDKQTEQQESSEQPELVPAHELIDGQPVHSSADNGLPYPDSRGVFRVKI